MNKTPLIKAITKDHPRLQPWALPGLACDWLVHPSDLAALAERFDPISLDQMEAVALLNRTDTKFVLTTRQLKQALAAVQPDYWMLSVEGQRLHHYRTLYFDSPDFGLYTSHVNGRADRYKVRSREYTSTRKSYLEVKHKTNKDRTIKDRLPTAHPVVQMTYEAENWLHGVFPYDTCALEPKLWNTFTRLTLVSKHFCERVTLDVDLTYYSNNRVATLDGLAIAEVKLDRAGCSSPFLALMRAQKIHPRGFSKYCIGVSMLYDQVKKNSMKPRLLWLGKISTGAIYCE
jgi:hypothetical protein